MKYKNILTVEEQKEIILGGGNLERVSPEIYDQIIIVSEAILSIHRKGNLFQAASFLSQLINLSAIGIVELRMTEKEFLDYCQQQYKLYLKYTSDNIDILSNHKAGNA